MKKSALIKIIACSAAAMAACFAVAGCTMGETRNYTVELTQAEGGVQLSSTEMLQKIRPTVVDVTSYSQTSASAGSGVIINTVKDKNGSSVQYFIVTNHHVIDGGENFVVDVLSIAEDGAESTTAYAATLVGSSKKRDIAVLSIAPPAGTQLSVATFIADSDSVKVGAEVFAIGNPLGILGGTVTHGIVSATKRNVNVGDIGAMTLMQTDALTNGGNSGGGLFDAFGNLVGIINSGYETYNGQQVEGLNFAIPANDAKFAALSLISTHTEQNGAVTGYGYVEGDANVNVAFSTQTLYTDSNLTSRAACLVASAGGADSPLYGEWSNTIKAVSAITVNGARHSFTGGAGSSYALTQAAETVVAGINAGDEVTVEYRDVLSRQAGFFATYNYVGSELKTASFTAQQYIYVP